MLSQWLQQLQEEAVCFGKPIGEGDTFMGVTPTISTFDEVLISSLSSDMRPGDKRLEGEDANIIGAGFNSDTT